jgi:Lipoxygenase
VAQFAASGISPIFPLKTDLEEKKNIFKWSDPSDNFPPHLDTLPVEEFEDTDNHHAVGTIFNPSKFKLFQGLSVRYIIPTEIDAEGTPFQGPTIEDCETYNRGHPGLKTDIMDGQNIGHLADWYSDARFAQQHLSGVNPSTVKMAPPEQVKAYVAEADKQGIADMKTQLSGAKDLLIQDYSLFRKATGVADNEEFKSETDGYNGKVRRYACASVVIFQLHEDGRLHPLAITLDYRGSLDKSITIFNQRLTPDDKKSINEKGFVDEKIDWPWRYAKTCAQTADWALHEISVHLVETHMIEEAIIVATNRTIPEDHLLYDILSPHWYRTLALNASARANLLPQVIETLCGFGTADRQSRAYKLVNWSYQNFNFQEKYIPNDLKKRGFDPAVAGKKYSNYPYASCMHVLWGIIRDFVKSMLAIKYTSDKDVQADSYISDWYKEIQTKGQIITFPTITTLDQLIDAATMCIHIASPQHTAVNYLQSYYYSFVPAKPPALCTALPKDLKTLQAYTKEQFTAALPIGTEEDRWRHWLFAAQIPELLSYKVDQDYSLLSYAKSLYNVNKHRSIIENKKFNAVAIKEAAASFYSRLRSCEQVFKDISAKQTPGTIPYNVLTPELTAVSILI